MDIIVTIAGAFVGTLLGFWFGWRKAKKDYIKKTEKEETQKKQNEVPKKN